MTTKNLCKKKNIHLLLTYCRNINEWPIHWSIESSDIKIGNEINDFFKKFLTDCIDRQRAKSTVKIYARHLQFFGSQLIQRFHLHPKKENISAFALMSLYVESLSLNPNAYDAFQQLRYHSFCKLVLRFVQQHQDGNKLD